MTHTVRDIPRRGDTVEVVNPNAALYGHLIKVVDVMDALGAQVVLSDQYFAYTVDEVRKVDHA